MKRREPPPLGSWMLEHLTSGDRDEALAGDLLEVYRSGRSNGWYWRQVCGACAVSWYTSIRTRISLFFFVLAWSMLAPAWCTIIERIENSSRFYGYLQQLEWPFSGLTEILVWVGLNLVFLWSGILLYFLLQWRQLRPLSQSTIRSAFLKTPVFLLPPYFATFVLANLFAYPGLAIDGRAHTLLGQITDLRPWADVIRLPYLIALVASLWTAVPNAKRGSHLPVLDDDEESASVPLPNFDAFTLSRFFSLMVAAGLVNALIVAVLFCRLPDMHAPNFGSLLIRATMYVPLGALAGVVGSYLYWKSPTSPFRQCPPLPFPLFALVCAAGWVWVVPMVLLAEQVSPATAFAAMIGAFVLTAGLRGETYPASAFTQPAPSMLDPGEGDLFAESMSHAPFEPHGYIVAIGIYAAGAALYSHSNNTASLWLAVSAAVFAWKNTTPRSRPRPAQQRYRKAALRLALVFIPAIVLTAWAMLDGIAHRNRMAAEHALAAAQNDAKTNAKSNAKASALGSSGYESLILWPFPPKRELVAPVDVVSPLLAPGTKQPLILRFEGDYEYVQPPDQEPGPTAHHARGTPLRLDIASNNNFPVTMLARQGLRGSIPTSRCREIDVEIENNDNRSGIVSLGLLLASGLPGHKRTDYLGQHTIESTEPGNFYIKGSPITETVRFEVPASAKLRKFSEITVLFLPDSQHMFITPRIAIREFQLVPR